jgi:hypothetical protein
MENLQFLYGFVGTSWQSRAVSTSLIFFFLTPGTKSYSKNNLLGQMDKELKST